MYETLKSWTNSSPSNQNHKRVGGLSATKQAKYDCQKTILSKYDAISAHRVRRRPVQVCRVIRLAPQNFFEATDPPTHYNHRAEHATRGAPSWLAR